MQSSVSFSHANLGLLTCISQDSCQRENQLENSRALLRLSMGDALSPVTHNQGCFLLLNSIHTKPDSLLLSEASSSMLSTSHRARAAERLLRIAAACMELPFHQLIRSLLSPLIRWVFCCVSTATQTSCCHPYAQR